MAQIALLTGSVVRETLNERKGELVVERAPASEGKGWIVTLALDGARCVVVTERKIQLRIFREINSAVAFVERNSSQTDLRIVFEEATDVPMLGLPPQQVGKASEKSKTTTSKSNRSHRKRS